MQSGYRLLGLRTATWERATPSQRSESESWYSPELHEVMEMRLGAELFELTQVQRAEPELAKFYPPAGYAIEPGH